MPKLPSKIEQEKQKQELIALALAQHEGWNEPSSWRRSKKGNLFREWDDRTVTVYRTQYGRFGWSISRDDGDVDFSETTYRTKREARDALGSALGVGDY